jgi:hypothetical protein
VTEGVEFHGLYCPPNIIPVVTKKRMRWAWHVTHVGEEGCIYNLVGKPEGKRALGRPPRRWEDYIKMDFQEIGWGNGLD